MRQPCQMQTQQRWEMTQRSQTGITPEQCQQHQSQAQSLGSAYLQILQGLHALMQESTYAHQRNGSVQQTSKALSTTSLQGQRQQQEYPQVLQGMTMHATLMKQQTVMAKA